METVLPDSKTSVRPVILDPKDNFLVLDDLDRDPMIEPLDLPVSQATHRIININGTNHLITTTPRLSRPLNINKPEVQFSVSSLSNAQLPMTPLGTLDLSLPKKPDPSVLEQFVNPGALVSESSVLKALSKPDSGNILTKDHLTGKIIRTTGQKVRRAKARDENGNGTPYIHRKTTSLGALGQALHGPLMGESLSQCRYVEHFTNNNIFGVFIDQADSAEISIVHILRPDMTIMIDITAN